MKVTIWTLTAALMVGGLSINTAIAQQTAASANAGDSAQVQAHQTLTKAIGYLRDQQKPDGGWASEKEPPAFTALVLRALVGDGNIKSSDDWIKKGYDRLLQFQLEDGGIYQSALATYQTAIAISALTAANDPAYRERIDKAVAYLRKLQWGVSDITGPKGERIVEMTNPWYGGWGYGGQSRGSGRPDLSNTQMALDALRDAGVAKDDPAFAASIQFVSRLQNHSETNPQPWASDDGGFVYGPNADGNGESLAGEYTAPDGKRLLRSYGSMSYAGLKSMIYAGLDKDDARVKAAWDWITRNWTLDENPGMRAAGPESAQMGLYYYYLTLARALNAYDQPTFTAADGRTIDWRIELIQKLSSLQKEDGSWVGEQRWMESNPVLVTSYVVQALHETLADLQQHPAR